MARPPRLHALLALPLALAACDSPAALDGGPDAAPDAGPPTCTVFAWDPASGNLDRWPEPSLVVDDATTETGHRLRFVEEDYPTLVRSIAGYLPVFTEDLGELDGFGTTAPAFFTFGRAFDASALPSGPTAEPTAGVGLAVLGADPELRAVDVEATDEGRTLIVAPSTPLPPRATVVAFVTRALTAAAQGCLEPSAAMAAALAAPSAEESEAIAALVSLGVITSASELVALTVYPTQSIEEDTLAVAADIAAAAAPSPVAPATCTDEALFRRCDLRLPVADYRDEDGVFRRAGGAPASPQRTYELPVTFWLPLEGEGPFPTFFFGHGLTGDRGQAARLAEFAAPLGLATVASPALEHGEHPANETPNPDQLNALFNFFAIGDLRRRALHATRLRDNFRQTAWDRLQVTRHLEQSPDVDGDGAPDVDGARLLYLGVSLGGLMGPELLAATDAYGAGVLVVPGGRVSTIISDSAQFGAIITALRPANTSEGDVDRFFPILQTVLDAGDPAMYGEHLLERRFAIAPETVDVLVGVVLDDDTVPNISNYTLGRAMRVPIVEPLLRPEPGFEVVTGPVSANFANGATGGLLQFDRIGDGDGTRPATHGNVGDSDVGVEAWLDFLQSHLDGATRIRDPYAAVGL